MVNKTVQEILKSTCFDGMLLISQVNRFWYSKFSSSFGFLVINNQGESKLLLDGRYYENAKETINVSNLEVVLIDNTKTISEQLELIFKKLNINSLLLESEYTTLKDLNYLKNIFLEKIHSFDSAILRAVKTKDEIEKLQKAADIAALTIEWAKTIIKPGMTEIQVANMISNHMLEMGASKNSFDPIVASGVNGSFPHHHPTNKVIQHLDMITLDIGCIYEGYCSDITRTFILGTQEEFLQKGNKELIEIYNVVLDSQLKGIKEAKSGINGKDLDLVCRNIISSTKFKDYFVHSTGHGVGIEVHELPNVSKSNLSPFVQNNVITIEPGIYVPELGGVRIEDTIVIQDNEALVLTRKANKKLFLG